MSTSSSHLITCYHLDKDDFQNPAKKAGKQDDKLLTNIRNLITTKGPPGPPGPWLSSHGWDILDETSIAAWAVTSRRDKPRGMDPEQGGAHFYLVDAIQAESTRNLS